MKKERFISEVYSSFQHLEYSDYIQVNTESIDDDYHIFGTEYIESGEYTILDEYYIYNKL